MGVVTSASGTRSLIWGKIMAENSLDLVLLQYEGFLDEHISINQIVQSLQTSLLYYNFMDYTVKYRSEINKSHPRIRAALD